MDGICTHIASKPGPWRDWYENERPETRQLPIETGDTDDATSLSAIHKLLMIRCLRSDRFERAMRILVESEVGDLMERALPNFDEVLSSIKHSIPVFVLMPDHSTVNTPFMISPVDSIRRMAEVTLVILILMAVSIEVLWFSFVWLLSVFLLSYVLMHYRMLEEREYYPRGFRKVSIKNLI